MEVVKKAPVVWVLVLVFNIKNVKILQPMQVMSTMETGCDWECLLEPGFTCAAIGACTENMRKWVL